jgi:hypothetical protein
VCGWSPRRALKPSEPLAGTGARRGGRTDLRASPASRPELAQARRRTRDQPATLDGASGAPPRRVLAPAGCQAPCGRAIRVAVPRQPAAHGRQALRKFSEPGHAMTGDRTRRAPRSAGSTATRSSVTAVAWPTASCTTTRSPRRSPHYQARAEPLCCAGRRRGGLMTDNAFTYVNNRLPARAGHATRDPATWARGPTHQTKGNVERYPTLQRKWAYALEYVSRARPEPSRRVEMRAVPVVRRAVAALRSHQASL